MTVRLLAEVKRGRYLTFVPCDEVVQQTAVPHTADHQEDGDRHGGGSASDDHQLVPGVHGEHRLYLIVVLLGVSVHDLWLSPHLLMFWLISENNYVCLSVCLV